MKNQIKKTTIAVLFFFIAIGAKAQTSDNAIHAFFKGTETEVKNNIKANTLTFSVSGLSDKDLATAFSGKAKPYSKNFTMIMNDEINGQRECKINFTGTPDLKWVLRFFLASSVKDVEQNNVKKNPNDFFKPYMQ